MNNFFHEFIAELKTGPNVFLHGPEFWLVFPWVCLVILVIALFGGNRK